MLIFTFESEALRQQCEKLEEEIDALSRQKKVYLRGYERINKVRVIIVVF
jgi:hypothetical protein